MYASLTQRAYRKWQQYWEQEPWGPWRDNLHIAVLAREVARPHSTRGSRIPLDRFMYKDVASRKAERVDSLFGMLGAMATPVSAEEAMKRRKKRNRGKRR